MTNAERQLLLLIADAAVELLGNTFAASDEPMTALRLEIGYRLAEARQSALQASQGPDGIHDPHGAIRTASDAPTPSTGHQRELTDAERAYRDLTGKLPHDA